MTESNDSNDERRNLSTMDPFYIGAAIAAGVLWWGLYRTPENKDPSEAGKEDGPPPPLLRSKIPYRDLSLMDPINSRDVYTNLVSVQEAALNGLPKTTSIGRGGTLYVSRTTPDKLLKHVM